jgi:hypothetical protein
VGCIEPTSPVERPSIDHQADAINPSPLEMTGGTVRLGSDGTLTVSLAPATATVELYMSKEGEGPQDCVSLAPRCVDLVNGSLYATAVADSNGVATFVLDGDDFPVTEEVAWQAIAISGATEEVGHPVVRHVAIPLADSALALVKVTEEVGIGPLWTEGNTHTGGAIWVDYNTDLWPDLFVANGSGVQNSFYRNNGDGTFTHIEGILDKPDIRLEPSGTKYADIDNDRDYDILVTVDDTERMQSTVPQDFEGGPNLLFVNQGNGTFVESAASAGLVDPRGWRNSDAAFADYDLDGCIDVFLGNWAMSQLPPGDNFSRLMRGNCDGTFDDVTAIAGTDGSGRDTLVTFWWGDANMDRLPDLYVGNVSHTLDMPDYDPTDNFYYNLGDGVFQDQVPSAQPWLGLDAWAAMGADVGDIDLDGDWDLYIADSFSVGTAPNGNALYLGSSDGTLSANVCSEHDACGGYNAWPINFADFNRDTLPDMWIGSSRDYDLSLVYINKGDGTFEHHEQADFGGVTGRGGSIADYDGDGDLDLFYWAHEGMSELYRNDPVDTNHWLEVRLYGLPSTWDAIGATVFVTANGVRQMRRVSGGDSAHSQTEPIMHFGLGDADTVDLLEVQWPSGTVHSFVDVAADDLVIINEVKGMQTERIQLPTAQYDAANDTLVVNSGSSFGGRTVLTAEGFGTLRYDAALKRHVTTFTGVATNPGTVRVSSARGPGKTVTVTVL